MKTYEVTGPDGATFEVTAPDDATDDQVIAYAKAQMASAPAEKAKPTFADLPGNIIPSAVNFGKGILGSVTSPLQTANVMWDAAAGGLRNLTPEPIRSFIDKAELDADAQQAQKRIAHTASGIGEFYANRYGSLDKAKESLITDPVGVAADASTVLGIGGALAPGKVGNALTTASKFTNPLSVIPVASKVVSAVAKPVLGLTTGVGAENIAQAAKAGYKGDTRFWKNLSGETPITDVLDDAKMAIANMGRQKSAEYRANMAAVKADKSVLSFAGIDKAVSEADDMVSFKGQVKNARAASAINEMASTIDDWKKLDPAEFHTPEGLDALKQRLNATLESLPFEEKTARLAAGKVYSAVKESIAAQAPVYTKTMADYAKASEQISEIERALSLGNKAAKDTAIRKLQSLTRNNVNTNYGNRLDLAKTLEQQGGVDILPSLAGQAMNTWTARGLGGQAENIATIMAAGIHDPMIAAALPFQSPKAVGASLYGMGRASGAVGGLLGRSGVTPDRARLASLLMSEADRFIEDQD